VNELDECKDHTSRILVRDAESRYRLIDILEKLSKGKIRLSGLNVAHIQGGPGDLPPLCVEVVYQEIEALKEEERRLIQEAATTRGCSQQLAWRRRRSGDLYRKRRRSPLTRSPSKNPAHI